jgi:DNA-binding NtrC family response regulator
LHRTAVDRTLRLVTDPTKDVVLVDDHDDTRELAAEVLRMEGFVVRDFSSAEEAMADVERAWPCAIVSDLTLGGMSGDELARQMRGRARRVALVAVTGHTSASRNPEALWDRVLIKPIDPFALARTLRDLVA